MCTPSKKQNREGFYIPSFLTSITKVLVHQYGARECSVVSWFYCSVYSLPQSIFQGLLSLSINAKSRHALFKSSYASEEMKLPLGILMHVV